MAPASASDRHSGRRGRPARPAGRSRLLRGILASLALVVLVWSAPAPAGADAVAGSATITRPNGATPLDGGGSATLYGVVLPAGATCPGDTAHHGYHVFSFLVPVGVSPASVSFRTGLPSKGFGYITFGSYYGAINTAENTGQIVGVPPQFTWSRLTRHDLFPAGQTTTTWTGGLACADTHGVVTDYWASRIRFTASASDPGGFTWRVLAQPAAASSHGRLWIGVGLLVLAALFGGLAVLLGARRDRASPSGRSDGTPGTPPAHPTVAGPTDRRADRAAAEPTPAGR